LAGPEDKNGLKNRRLNRSEKRRWSAMKGREGSWSRKTKAENEQRMDYRQNQDKGEYILCRIGRE
jgi:hypothetical protein